VNEPFELLKYKNSTAVPKALDLVIGRFGTGGGNPRLKILFLPNGAMDVSGVEYRQPAFPDAITGAIFGHNGSGETLTIAAVPYVQDSTPEGFSSRGAVVLYFGPVDGTTPALPLTSPQVLAKPDMTATDGALNSFFGPVFNGGHYFFGTSAAAPHAAAVAALLKEAQPAISPASIENVLESTARVMTGGRPKSVGAGLIDAFEAVRNVEVAN
jgi:subtilisin family serine protease